MPVATQKEQESTTQPEKKKREPVYFKEAFSSPRNFARYVAYKFSADQWFGTFFMLGVIYWNALSIREGKSRQATAKGTDRSDLSAVKTRRNWPQIVGGFVFNCSNIWTLFSARKAKPPEGKNQLERMWNAIRHPNESQLQTVHAIGLPFMLGIIFNHIRYGFFDGEEEERFSRRVLAITSSINLLMTQSVLFGKGARDKSKETIKSGENPKENSKLPYPLRVLQMAWRENRQQIFSSTTGLIGALTLLTEGRMKRRSMLDRLEKATTIGSPQWHNMRTILVKQFGALSTQETLDKINGMRASKLTESSAQIKKGIAGIIITMMSAFYQMDQLLKGQKKASAEPSGGEPEKKSQEQLIVQQAEDRAPHIWRDRVTQHPNAARTVKPEQPLLLGRNMANHSPRSVKAIASGESLAVAQGTQR